MKYYDAKIKILCKEYKVPEEGIERLLRYYTENLHWDEALAKKYIIRLFKNGTITKIKEIK